MIDRLAKQVQNLIKRAYVTNTNSDMDDIPRAQVSFMGKVGDVETLWQYGTGGQLPVDALVVVFNNQAQEEYKMGIGTTPQDRFRGMAPGETWFGNPLTGSWVYFKQDGSIVVTAAQSAAVTVNAQNVIVNAPSGMVLNGNLQVNGTIKASQDITDNSGTNTKTIGNLRATYDIHTHAYSGTSGNTNIPNQIV